MDGAERLISFA